MRLQGLGVSLLLVAGAASGQPARAGDPLAAIPPDVAAARQLHAPPRVVVDVQTVKKSSNDDAHCHDPACMAIVLPFVLFKEAFPDKQDAVTITVEQTRFEGAYVVGGHFLHGRIDSPQGSRFFVREELPELGKTLIVESAHQGPGPKAPVESTPILSQVDLLSDYRKALASESLPEKRGALIKEALAFLKDESLPLLREWLANPSEKDAVKADLLFSACGDDRPQVGWELSRSLGEAARQAKTGAETQGAALFCLKDSETHKLPVPSKAILEQLASEVCHADDARVEKGLAFQALYKLYVEPPRPQVRAQELAGRCDRPDRRALLHTCLGAPATREDYAAVFKTPSKAAEQTWRCLQPDRPEFVVAFEEALRAEPSLERLNTLQRRQPPPTARELAVVAERYAQPSRIKDDLYDWRGAALQIFHRAAGQPALTADARAVLHEALKHPEVPKTPPRGGLGGLLDGIHRKLSKTDGDAPKAGGGEEPELRTALVVLGETAETLGAAAGLGPVHPGMEHTTIFDTTTLIELGLSLVGCTDDEIRDAAQASKQASKPPPGPFCRSQKPSAP